MSIAEPNAYPARGRRGPTIEQAFFSGPQPISEKEWLKQMYLDYITMYAMEARAQAKVMLLTPHTEVIVYGKPNSSYV